MKRNKKKTWTVIAVVLAAVLLLLLGVLLGLRSQTGVTRQDQSKTTQPAQELTFTTAFCQLKFPGKWEQQLQTRYSETDRGGSMTFCAKIGEKEAELFSIVFSETANSDAELLGVLTSGEAPVFVGIQFYDSGSEGDWTAEELDIVAAMSEECNYLIDQMQLLPDFDRNYAAYFAPEKMLIVTPFCTLSCSGEWEDQISWEFTDTDEGGILHVCGQVARKDLPLFLIYVY